MPSQQEVYIQAMKNCISGVTKLPAGEIKFYLFILINSVKGKNKLITDDFIIELSKLIENLNALHNPESFNPDVITQIFASYEELQDIANVHSFTTHTKNILLQIGSTILAFFTGVIGGIIGGVAGLARGSWNLEPFKGLGIGILTGFCLGAIFGFRVPKKLLKDELIRQVHFGLNGLHHCLENVQQSILGDKQTVKPFVDYFEAEKAKVRQECFTNDVDFEHFLNSDVTYEINSMKASFIGNSSLHGYVGQHLYIVIKINKVSYLIEFTQDPSNPEEEPHQQELRTVKGSKIIEMLATYQKLQETSACTLSFIASKMKPGDNDCHSFVNKVLITTDQPATKLKRYTGMNSVGTMIGFFITKLSPFDDEFYNISESDLSCSC